MDDTPDYEETSKLPCQYCCQPIGDWQDDCGAFYHPTNDWDGRYPLNDDNYKPVCKACYKIRGYSTGER